MATNVDGLDSNIVKTVHNWNSSFILSACSLDSIYFKNYIMHFCVNVHLWSIIRWHSHKMHARFEDYFNIKFSKFRANVLPIGHRILSLSLLAISSSSLDRTYWITTRSVHCCNHYGQLVAYTYVGSIWELIWCIDVLFIT